LASGIDSEVDVMAEVPDSQPTPVERALHVEANEKLRMLVKKLPLNEGRLIQMVYFEGYTLQDAAAILGFSKSWASRLHAKVLEDLARGMRQLGIHD
jgi:RNA polymerase sigma factor for flagellar operon FliA